MKGSWEFWLTVLFVAVVVTLCVLSFMGERAQGHSAWTVDERQDWALVMVSARVDTLEAAYWELRARIRVLELARAGH